MNAPTSAPVWPRTTARRAVAAVGAIALATLALGSGAAPSGAAGQGANHQKVPVGVVERVVALQRVFGWFTISPGSGPIGTEITYTGHCGFPADTVSVSLVIETEPGSFQAAAVRLFVPIPTSPAGAFTVTLVVPPEAVSGSPMQPGTYGAAAGCDILSPDERILGPPPTQRPFVLTSS